MTGLERWLTVIHNSRIHGIQCPFQTSIGTRHTWDPQTSMQAKHASKPLPKGGVFFSSSWLGLDAISAAEQGSLAGSNFLIRTPGLLAWSVPSPYSPSAKAHPTGLPIDHSHAQGTARVLSQRGDCGVTPVGLGLRRAALAQGPSTEAYT